MRVLATSFLVFAASMVSLAQADTVIKSAVLKVERVAALPISRLDLPPDDLGFAGARVATADNATTGRFIGQKFETAEATAAPDEAMAALDALIDEGAEHIVLIASADDVLALADHAAGRDVMLFNAAALDDRLRLDECRANVVHIAPSRAMLADALAQYLMWKRWDEWLLIHGSHEGDKLAAEAYRRAAKKFGAEIVEERGVRRYGRRTPQRLRPCACAEADPRFHPGGGRA